jgi:hypothetical protein
MVALFGQFTTARLKESSSTLFNRPLEDDNPCQMTGDVVGMIKECDDTSVCFYLFFELMSFLIFFLKFKSLC